eukprot:5729220-Pyramimonas_sp.AAC.1
MGKDRALEFKDNVGIGRGQLRAAPGGHPGEGANCHRISTCARPRLQGCDLCIHSCSADPLW